MPGTILYEVVDHVALITYNRPEALNRINGEFRADVNDTWQQFQDDQNAWIAIVTGAGEAFCAGADRSEGGSAGTWSGTFWEVPTINSFESGLEVWKPTIAAVNGLCQGYGLTGALACDFLIAAETAEFGFQEVRRGISTANGAMRLPHKIGWQHAMELLLTGDMISADRAKEIGLAGWVVPDAELIPEARRLAGRLLRGAPLAARAIKEMAHRGAYLPWIDALRMGETMRKVVVATEDFQEAMAAERENRDPVWRGC